MMITDALALDTPQGISNGYGDFELTWMLDAIGSPWCIGFLPEASFGLRVLSLPASVCVSVRPSVRPCVR